MITNVTLHLSKCSNPFASQKPFSCRLLPILFLLLISLAFISCSKENSSGNQGISKKITNRPVSAAVGNTAEEANGRLAARIPALDRTEASEPVDVRPDPFTPLFREDTGSAGSGDVNEESPKIECTGNTPLQKYDLSQLKLVGIVRTSGLCKAIVENASGKGFIVEMLKPDSREDIS
ncbi:MAG: hypothetical protein R2941_15060 [Desulfobacterales bacterium]